ncbi:MAG TPA: hypothetical protein VK479_02320, partial [Micropepsaceae bacterium]|nr:hypothetical protein [Micropepsaceae bacterium]
MSKWASTAGLLAGSTAMLAAAGFLAGAIAQTPAAPDFSSNQASWEQGNGVNFIPVPGSPPPIANDPAHPHYSNQDARRLGIQPTYR